MSFKDEMAATPLSRHQIGTIILCISLVVIEGYDIAVMSFSVPFIEQEGTSTEVLGFVLAAALLGMFIGSTFVAPIADRFGRRIVAIAGLTTTTVGMLCTMLSTDIPQLFMTRVVTGIGAGMTLASVGVLIAEATNKRWYSITMSAFGAGVGIGAALGGLIIAPFMIPFGWRFAFGVGAALGAVTILLAVVRLPESLDYLGQGKRADSLSRINVILRRMRRAELTELPVSEQDRTEQRGALTTIFGKNMIARTGLLLVGYFSFVLALYFFANWAPQIVVTITGDLGLAAPTASVLNIGGVVGALLFGLIAMRIEPRALTAILLGAAATTLLLFGFAAPTIGSPAVLLLVVLVGLTLNLNVAGFYTVIPPLYPTYARATGFGIITGIGRLGGVLAPILGGILLGSGIPLAVVLTVPAVAVAISALCLVALRIVVRKDKEEPVTEAAVLA